MDCLRALAPASLAAALVLGLAAPALTDASRIIETTPLTLIGVPSDAPAPPPPSTAQGETAIATPPLRLIGDGLSSPERAAPQALTIDTRPLKLLGAKP
jgi:hypothetical protein